MKPKIHEMNRLGAVVENIVTKSIVVSQQNKKKMMFFA